MTFKTWQTFDLDYFAGKYRGQRYGQAFCNHFHINNPTLFYQSHNGMARTMSMEYIGNEISDQ